MRKVLALWRRELIEHRGAFLYAPAVVLALFALTIAAALIRSRLRFDLPEGLDILPPIRFYEDAVLVGFVLWWVYFGAALFFYYADAFSADRRNNAMLFWKSMPVSDLGILISKLTAGMTFFAVLALSFMAIIALLLAALALLIGIIVPQVNPPAPAELAASFGSLMALAAAYLLLSLVWYAPLLAWVGALSTLVRRWAIPLAVFLPSAAGLVEVTVLRTSHIAGFLGARLSFGLDAMTLGALFYQLPPIDGPAVVAIVLMGIDWWQMAGGVAVSVLLVYLASEYRRRRIDT